MAFTAYKDYRDIAAALLLDLPTTEVGTELGITLAPVPAERIVRSRRELFEYPFIEVTPPRVSVTSALYSQITTTGQLWVNLFDGDADLDALDARMEGYALALGRLFGLVEGDGYTLVLVALEPSPPSNRNAQWWVQAVGARVAITQADKT